MSRRNLANIYDLGVKELWSLWRDPMMIALIVYVFTASVYTSATSMPETLHNAPIAIVDEDNSALSQRIASAFYPPQFTPPAMIDYGRVDPGMDAGQYTFALVIPPNFQRDVLARRSPALQLNVDATRMSQAFTGSGYIQQIAIGEVNEFVKRYRGAEPLPVDLALRARFNPSLDKAWFGSVVQIINHITLLSIILTGAALIREREHGTIEHLLVMPVTPAQIMLSKIWSMALVVLIASFLSLNLMVRGVLGVPIEVVANRLSAAPAKNSAMEPSTGTPRTPRTMRLRDRNEAISTTRAIDQTLESMICAGVTGITSRCSMVPCSRSRISAAPVRMMDNSVMWLMICTTEPNQALSSAGLKRARNARSTGGASVPR